MELKTFFAQDLLGNVIASPVVTVYLPGTTTLVTGLKDADGAALSNPFSGDGNGKVVLAAPDGDYDVTVEGAGRTTTMRVRFIDSAAGSADILRSDLLSTASGKGGELVSFKQIGADAVSRKMRDKAREVASLRDYGADANGAECWAAVTKAIAAGYNVLHLEYLPGETNVAYFGTFNADTLVGKTLDIDPRITLSVPDNQATGVPNSAGIRHAQLTRYYFRSLDDYYTVHPQGGELWYGNGARRVMPYLAPDDADLSFPVAITAASLNPRKIPWNASDTWATDTYSASAGTSFSFAPGADSSFHLGMAPCKPGDEFACSFAVSGGVPLIMALVRHTGGHAGVWSQADYGASTATFFNKATGSNGTSSPLNFLGAGNHGSYSGLGSVWTIRIDSWQSASILFNGYAVARFNTSGFIYECGFGGYPTGAGQTITVNDVVRVRGGQYRGGQFVAVRVYGDSKTADRYDAWPVYFKDAMEFTAGVRCWRVINRAIAGQAISQQKALMAGDNVADSNLVIIDIGTNDIQGQTNLASFISDLNGMVTQAQNAGCLVVLGVPSLWYTQGQAGAGKGQASTNYDRGAPYRSAVLLVAAQKGCRVVDNTRWDGPILAHYVNGSLGLDLTGAGDPVVYDNIHPTTEANKRRALAYAKAAAAFYANKRGTLYIPPHSMGATANGWATAIQAPRATVSDDGQVKIYGVVNDPGGATRTNGTTIFQLPPYLYPKDTLRVPCVSAVASEDVYVNVTTGGAVQVYGATSSAWVDISGISFSIEDREVL